MKRKCSVKAFSVYRELTLCLVLTSLGIAVARVKALLYRTHLVHANTGRMLTRTKAVKGAQHSLFHTSFTLQVSLSSFFSWSSCLGRY
jgi:hypothetical protein